MTNRELELLIWQIIQRQGGGSMTVPLIEDTPDRRVRFVRHKNYIECVMEE